MQAGIDGTYLAGEANVAEITPEDDLAPEVKATIREFTARGLEMADQMIAAYGKPVNEYNPVDRWAMACNRERRFQRCREKSILV